MTSESIGRLKFHCFLPPQSKFLLEFRRVSPHIFTGWNVYGFDIPYLVNRLNKDLFRNILAMATVKQYANELAMDFHTAIRYIERVADRSGNIAEYVYYAATGFRFPDNTKK